MFRFIILLLSLRYTSSSVLDSLLGFGTDSETTSSFYTAIINGIDCGCDRVSNFDVSEIKVYLYNFETNSNATYSIDNAAKEILNRSDFNVNQCIQIFIPGFNVKVNQYSWQTSTCTFSKITCGNVKSLALIIDHTEYTSPATVLGTIVLESIYKKAVRYAKSIGVKLGVFVTQLLDKVDRSKIDIIGHSLGGQIVGYVGETVKNNTGTLLKRIYAADPAGPCFMECPNEHVKSGQAEIVIAIHCNAGELGSNLNLVDYDFYSRSGQNQKDCIGGSTPGLLLRAAASTCSHLKCIPISENPSIRENIWKAVKCSSATSYLNDECNNNKSTLAGYRVTPTNSTGVYYFIPDDNLVCESKSIIP